MYLIIIVSFCFVSAIILLYFECKKPKNYPPGPSWSPIVGNFAQYQRDLKKFGYHHLVWENFSRIYGNVVGLKLGRSLIVTVFGPETIKEVLTRDEFEGRPDGFLFRMRSFGGRLGIVFTEGPFWQKQRKFSVQHLRNFGLGKKEMEDKIQEEVREFIESIKSETSAIFMHTIFDVSVINVLWAMMAGQRFPVDDEKLKKLLNIIHDAFKLIDISGGILNQLPFLRFIAPKACGYTQMLEILNRMWNFLEEAIEEHKQTLCHSHARDLIDAFLQQIHLKSDPTFTDQQLMALLLDLFMAGSETTSNTLSFAVIYMIKYPEVQKKVQNELDLVVGRNRWPTLQDRVNLKYTEVVLMEVQRKANIPPLGIAHRTVADANLMGYSIPSGTIVLTSLYSLHMDSEYWKDPQNFRPERFLDDDGNIICNESKFAPFGYGKRRCIGESLAKANYFMFFTTLLHNFHIEESEEGPFASFEGFDGVTISPKPFKAKLVVRSD